MTRRAAGDGPTSATTWRWVVAVGLLAALAAGAGVMSRATNGAQTTADEPYYLVTAQSLVEDGDLSIEDEIAAQPLPYHEITMDPQTTPVDDTGRRFSPHDPLLPVILAPAMALGGWVAAKVLLAILAGVTASLTTWTAVRRLDVAPRTAGLVVGAAFVGIPFTTYGTQVYPELPAALVTLAGVAALTAPRADRRALAGVVLSVVALPWLALKYAPVAAVVAVLALARWWRGTSPSGVGPRRLSAANDALGRRPPTPERSDVGSGQRRDAVVAFVVLAVAGVVYLVVHQRIYGGWTVYAAGDHFVDTGELSVVGTRPNPLGRARRLVGLVVDRDFGLAAWAPIWFGGPLAVAALWVERHRHRVALLAPLAAGWLTATFVALTMHGYWSPGRQVVVVLPLAVLALARLADRSRPFLVAAVVAGVAGLVNWLVLAWETSTGRRTIVVDFTESLAPVRRVIAPLLPDGVVARPLDDVLLGVWTLVLLGSVVLGLRHLARPSTSSAAPARAARTEAIGQPS